MEKDPTKRFSDRVDLYVKYRPHYPQAVLVCLQEECGLTETAVTSSAPFPISKYSILKVSKEDSSHHHTRHYPVIHAMKV